MNGWDRRPDGRYVFPPEWERRIDAAMWMALFIIFLYLLIVVGPQFAALLHRDGVL